VACGSGEFNKNYHKVTQIIDGNTLKVRNGVTIHLIGINNTQQSYDYLVNHVLNKKIWIKFDSKKHIIVSSKYDRVFAYVKEQNTSINAEILKLSLSSINNTYLNDSLNKFLYYSSISSPKTKSDRHPTISKKSNQLPQINKAPIKNLQQLVKETEPAVFLISTYNNHREIIGTGTGFFIQPNGLAISNFHVFENGKSWRIKTLNGEYQDVSEILYANKKEDLIIFRVGNIADKSALILSTSKPLKGEDIFVLGNPKGLESTVTKGVVSSLRSWVSKDDFIQIDAPISPGSSGSPVLNMKGKVIGIATLKIKGDCESCNFAINIEIVRKKLNSI